MNFYKSFVCVDIYYRYTGQKVRAAGSGDGSTLDVCCIAGDFTEEDVFSSYPIIN